MEVSETHRTFPNRSIDITLSMSMNKQILEINTLSLIIFQDFISDC